MKITTDTTMGWCVPLGRRILSRCRLTKGLAHAKKAKHS